MLAILFSGLASTTLPETSLDALLAAVVVTGIATLAATAANMFHSPHDVISEVRVCSGKSGRKTVFAISRHNLVRSKDEGKWEWLTSGLGPYKLSSIAVSPAFGEDQTVFAASFGGGVYRSRDGGLSWVACNTGLEQRQILRLAIAPDFRVTGSIMALGLDGVAYLSRDSGDTWCTVLDPKPAQADLPPLVALTVQHAQSVLLDLKRDASEAWNLCYRPTGATCITFAGRTILVGTSAGNLHASEDHGSTWQLLARIPGAPRITCIEAPPGTLSNGTLFAGTDGDGVWRISAGGKAVERAARASGLEQVTALASRESADNRICLVACAWGAALFVSNDMGASWLRSARGLSMHRQADERRYGAPHFSAIAIVGAPSHELYVGGFDGLFHAENADSDWESIETLPAGMVVGVALSPETSGQFSIAISTYGAGVAMRPTGVGPWTYRNVGLATTRVGPIAFSPRYDTDRTLFAGSEGRVLVSHDAGAKWQACTLSPPAAGGRSARMFTRIRAVERLASRHLSPAVMKRLKSLFQAAALRAGGRVSRFVFPTMLAFSPDYERDRTLFVGTRAHGIFRSQDGGRSYRQLWDCAGHFVFSLAVAPGHAVGAPLFASLSEGLYCSRDCGATWTNEQADTPFRGAVLAMSPSFDRDSTLFVAGPGGLVRSRDGGKSWATLFLTRAHEPAAIYGIALSPAFSTDRTLLVQACGLGLFRSTDEGDTFEPRCGSAPDRNYAFHLMNCFPDSATLFQFSPCYARDRTVVAACVDQILVSPDGGMTWNPLQRATRYENFRPEITYRGRWTLDFNPAHSAQQAHRSRRPADSASVKFLGTHITWLGTRGPDHGMASVFIDSQLRTTLDLYAPHMECSQTLYSASLPPGTHRITIEVLSKRNRRSSGHAVCVDAFDVQLDDGPVTSMPGSEGQTAC
jgi:photosystem II stability/assembly factor-like uncharacterized protein